MTGRRDRDNWNMGGWTRGDLSDETSRRKLPRRREAWQQKHNQIFRAVWGDQARRTFPPERLKPLPVIRTRRKAESRLRLILLFVFIAGAVGGWLLK